MKSGVLHNHGGRILLVVAIVAIVFLFARRESEEEKAWWRRCAELEARGEHLDLEAFIPHEIPDEENFFKAPGMEKWFTLRNGMPRNSSSSARTLVVPGWLDRPLSVDEVRAMPVLRSDRAGALSVETASFGDLVRWRSEIKGDYRMLQDASRRPGARLDADYSDPVNRDRVDFAAVWEIRNALLLRARMALVEGDPEGALEGLNLCRRIADVAGSEPSLVGTAMRAGVLDEIGDVVDEALRDGAFESDRHLAALQDCIRNPLLAEGMMIGLQIQRAELIHLFWKASKGDGGLDVAMKKPFESVMNGRPVNWSARWDEIHRAIKMRSRSWRAANSIVVVNLFQDVLGSLRVDKDGFPSAQLDAWSAATKKRLTTPAADEELAAASIPNFFPNLIRNTFAQQTRLDQLLVVCALERHRLEIGALPDTLAVLVPRYLDEIPRDLFSGDVLRYARDGEGYILWSVGWDGKDDGGRSVGENDGAPGHDPGDGDWVWRFDVRE